MRRGNNYSGARRAFSQQPRGKRITQAKAARLVAAMEAIRECADFPDGELTRAFEDVRQAISPWYDGEEEF
jgi:hypothetical protein